MKGIELKPTSSVGEFVPADYSLLTKKRRDMFRLTREGLTSVKRRALRKRVWFRVLSRVERGIVDLTIRCVDRVRSLTLAGVIGRVLAKLADAMRSRVERLMETVGCPLAARLSEIAQGWGHRDAWEWVEDKVFIRYLTVLKMNDNVHFR